jgi:drug/metabolite transporter (DMT)-like permease
MKKETAINGACVVWYVLCCTVKTLLTKELFSGKSHYAYPLFYSSMSCAVTAVAIVVVAHSLGIADSVLRVPPRAHCGALVLVVVITAADMGATNLAVERLSVALQQTIKAVLPVLVVLLEVALLKKRHSRAIYGALVPITLGPILIGWGQIDAAFTGVVCMCAAVACSALKNIKLHTAMKDMKKQVGIAGVTLWLEILMLPLLLAWSAGAGELLDGAAPNALVSVDAGGANYDLAYIVTFVALLGGVRAHATNMLLRHCTPAVLAVANVLVQTASILASFYLFPSSPVTWSLGAGVALSIVGVSIFAYGKHAHERASRASAEARAGLDPVDFGSSDDAHDEAEARANQEKFSRIVCGSMGAVVGVCAFLIIMGTAGVYGTQRESRRVYLCTGMIRFS